MDVLGRELKRIYFYDENLFDKRGELIIYEDGYRIVKEDHTVEIPKNMVISFDKGNEMPFAKVALRFRYLDFSGVERDINLIISREDVSALVNDQRGE